MVIGYSILIPNRRGFNANRALVWARSRLGPEADWTTPRGAWMWSEIPGLGTLVTLPNEEILFEMRLVEPWQQ